MIYSVVCIPKFTLLILHDDVIKWKHFPRYWPFVLEIHRSTMNSPHKGQWRGALMFSVICARINGWVNNREAGDLRRHRAHYDVIVMLQLRFNAPNEDHKWLWNLNNGLCCWVAFRFKHWQYELAIWHPTLLLMSSQLIWRLGARYLHLPTRYLNMTNWRDKIQLCDLRHEHTGTTGNHYSEVIMRAMASQITSLTIVHSAVYHAQIKENIKAPRHWPLCGKFTGDRWIPRTNGQLRGKCFAFDDVIMIASC